MDHPYITLVFTSFAFMIILEEQVVYYSNGVMFIQVVITDSDMTAGAY